MKINLELNEDELVWLARKISQLHHLHFEIDKIYRNDEGIVSIKLKEMLFKEIKND